MSVIGLTIARHHLREPDDDDDYLELLIERPKGRPWTI